MPDSLILRSSFRSLGGLNVKIKVCKGSWFVFSLKKHLSFLRSGLQLCLYTHTQGKTKGRLYVRCQSVVKY